MEKLLPTLPESNCYLAIVPPIVHYLLLFLYIYITVLCCYRIFNMRFLHLAKLSLLSSYLKHTSEQTRNQATQPGELVLAALIYKVAVSIKPADTNRRVPVQRVQCVVRSILISCLYNVCFLIQM